MNVNGELYFNIGLDTWASKLLDTFKIKGFVLALGLRSINAKDTKTFMKQILQQ